jgi:hypothetical protein
MRNYSFTVFFSAETEEEAADHLFGLKYILAEGVEHLQEPPVKNFSMSELSQDSEETDVSEE